jgi:putative SOS response-associated peptidase YedK
MCGRMTQQLSSQEYADYFSAQDTLFDLGAHYNVAPTQVAAVVLEEDHRRVVAGLRWGLVPPWAPDLSIGSKMINARAETVSEKPSFRKAFQRRRCIVPANSFYEWKRTGSTKIPFAVGKHDGSPLALAGLWETWRDKDADRQVRTFTILTTEANTLMQPIHDRMPVILPDTVWSEWLDPANEDIAALSSLLVPYPADQMRAYPISTLVNNVRNDGPELIRPIEAAS